MTVQRDLNLIRKILLFIEALPPGAKSIEMVIPGHSRDEIEYNAELLVERGLLKGQAGPFSNFDKLVIFPDAITFEGHDFLDAARSDNVWLSAMEWIGSETGSASLAVVKNVLETYARKQLRLS